MSHELRTPLERHPRLHRADPRRHLRRRCRRRSREVLERVQSQRQAPARADQRRARPLEDRGRPAHARRSSEYSVERRGPDGASAQPSRWPTTKKLALTAEVAAGPADRSRRRAAAHAGAAQPRRQRHQVHRHGRGAHHAPVPPNGYVHRRRDRHRSRHTPEDRSDLRGVPADRQLQHQGKGGTGLGLAIAKRSSRCTAAHLGRIDLGKGSTFQISCPVPRRGTEGGRMTKRILMIEDTEDNRQIVRDLIDSGG